MADKYVIKQHDLEPPFRVRLLDGTTPVANLDDADSLRFIVANRAGVKIDAAIVPVAPQTGTNVGWVEYQWVSGDTDTVAAYDAEVEVTWPGTRPQTFPVGSYIKLEVKKDLA